MRTLVWFDIGLLHSESCSRERIGSMNSAETRIVEGLGSESFVKDKIGRERKS